MYYIFYNNIMKDVLLLLFFIIKESFFMIFNEAAMNKYMMFIHLFISVKIIETLRKKSRMYSNGNDINSSKQLRYAHSLSETGR